MSLAQHFGAIDGLEPDERWLPLKLINGWQSSPWSPAVFRYYNGGVDFAGNIFGGEEGKPQAWLPHKYLPRFEDGADRWVQTWFSTGFHDHFTGQDVPGKIGPRLTIFRNGEIMLEMLDAFGGLPLEAIPLHGGYPKT